ncbi:hypothetical protein DUE52_07435 [Larkinella punicea]|uniref:ABC transmembrane type-1 domain-containing protein n=1 Tax=Larkinella punicea TaxID=2315727 RepID=A0A368JRD3_9BACT|nr:ABC transporter transmembrane domain-containing protein [Larkinella punicea]RCR70188.1 hypothetical protein DUE52_07435 [Larkinella punicea]
MIRDDVPLLGIAAGLGILIAVLGLSMALFSQRLIDDILPKQNAEKLTLGLVLLAVLLLARSGLNYLRSFFLLRQSREFNIRIADSFFRDLLRLPKAFFDTRKTGDLVARLNDTRRIQSTISFLTGSVVIDTLVVLITAGVLFRYSWQIGLLSLLSFPLYGWLVWRFNGRIITGQREVMASYARTESHFIDSMSGIGAIKAGRREEFFARITQSVYQLFQHKLYDLGLLGNRYGILSEVVGVGLLMALISVTAFMVLQKHLLLGEMMAIISMASTLISSVSKLSTTNIQLQEARVAFDRMREFFRNRSKFSTGLCWITFAWAMCWKKAKQSFNFARNTVLTGILNPFRKATLPWLVKKVLISPADNSNWWGWLGRCTGVHNCCCWMKQLRHSTARPSSLCWTS